MANKYRNARSKGFRSGLEEWTKAQLDEAGLKYCYECMKIELLPSIEYPSLEKPSTGKKKEFKVKTKEIRVTYTPDFVGENWIIETKGMRTPDFNIKWKMLKHWLKASGKDWKLFMPTNRQEVLISIKKILDE